jgi:hypothetical protein
MGVEIDALRLMEVEKMEGSYGMRNRLKFSSPL